MFDPSKPRPTVATPDDHATVVEASATVDMPAAGPGGTLPEQVTGVVFPETFGAGPGAATVAEHSRTEAIPALGAGTAAEVSTPQATGVYTPTAAGSTGEYHPAATEGGGAPGPDVTGVYVPVATEAFGPSPQPGPRALAATEAIRAVGGLEGTLPATMDVPRASGPAPAPAAPDDRPRCGHYVLKQFHAKGGMGEIWMAEDPVIGRSVALKRMFGHRPDQIHRFIVEAQVTGQLEHPGIAPVHELGVTEEGHPYYAMKFVQGRTLQKIIEEYHAQPTGSATREVEQFRLLQIFLSLCQTVAYAHSRGVLHRDLKPENVMLGAFGETILLDWGIAKVMGQPDAHAGPEGDGTGTGSLVHLHEADEETATRAGAILGTPSYMAPEVAAGLNAEVDQRSDVYLLGATLYEILTGRQPRRAKTVLELIKKAKTEPPVPASQVRADVPKPLEAICVKAMALHKEDRYASALDLAADVQRYLAGEPVTAYPEPFLTRAWRWARRHRKALARSAAAVVVVGATVVVVSMLRDAERRRVEAQRVADRLRLEDRTRRDLKEFRRLADEARYYAATTDPVSQHAPYFDGRKGEAALTNALALAGKWGPTLAGMPLEEERAPLRRDLYDLILLTAQVKLQNAEGPAAAHAAIALLDGAGRLHEPTRSYYRLRSEAYRHLSDEGPGQARPEETRGAETYLDHFLLGERHRNEAAGRHEGETERKSWQHDPELLEKAVVEYRRALALAPDHYWSLFQLGRCHLSLGRLAESVEALGACIALRPDSPWGYSVRGLAFAQQGRFSEAEGDLDRALRSSPDFRAPRLNRGAVYWMQKKDDQALADFEAVLQPPRELRLIEAAFYRGQLYLQRGEIPKALEDFDRVVAEDPAFRPVYPIRAQVHIALGNDERALKDLDAALAGERPAKAPAWSEHANRGRLLRVLHAQLPQERRGEPWVRKLVALAVSELLKAVQGGARVAQLFDDLGAMLEHAGQLNDAILSYTQGLRLDPDHVRMRIKRGWALELTGRHDDAQADFAAAIRLDPENGEAHSGLGYLRAVGKLPADAQREAELALLHGAENYLVVHNVACIYSGLSQAAGPEATAYQDVAMALLRRAVEVWRRKGEGPSEIELIKGDPAFEPLKGRADFQQLIGGKP